ncbi:MAG: hypothetical protein KC482_03150 [Dehalococcoidia bacterium]|nr:hypothetical protein [Dehalococcoidia bacterium]MCA9824887.1 hypothetical protein [Dehalococcoidia bacterium]MCA9843610.1 hypothetical protein [Dehalococcoidia bacterium]MCA9852584.1 hypothetical protein [Dehalococcoidia bacterium]
MVDVPLPPHVVIHRRDGKREILLHRSVAVIGDTKIEVKSARSTVILPLIGLGTVVVAGLLLGAGGSALPFWALAAVLFYCLFAFPISVMGLVGAVVGADIVVDADKGSATWQQGYLGMGIGTKELVPFPKIDYLEVTIEGAEEDRWRGESDSLRQFALWMVKKSGKRLRMAQIPVAAYTQEDGMDRTLALGSALATLTGAEIRIPKDWELVEIDTETLEPVKRKGKAKRR